MTNRFSELTQDIQDRIREIAYLMWESAGRQHGMAMEYWLSAEQEVLSTLQAAAQRMIPDAAKTKSAAKSEPAKTDRPALEAPASEAPPASVAAAPSAASVAAAPSAASAARPAVRRATRAKAKV
jgi:hypothetical protein